MLGALGFIIVGVGAFQFMGGSSTPVKKKPPVAAPAAADATADNQVKNPAFAMALPPRDPFKPPADSGEATPQAKPTLPTPQAEKPRPRSLGGRLSTEVLPSPGGSTSIAPLNPGVEAPRFGYRLSGLISGRHPAAVFTDSSGAQRLVPLSGSLDGDTQLVAVEKGRAVVSFRGKHLKLSLGGTPDAN